MTGLPAALWAGHPATATITAYDAGGAVALGYDGVAAPSSSDPSASFLGPVNFTSGVGTATVTFATLGDQTLTVTDVAHPSLTATGTTKVRPAGAMVFYPVTPCRAVDTRGASGTFGWPPIGPAGSPDRAFPLVSSGCGIPATARAVSLNVTVVNPTVAGELLVYPGGTDPDVASTVAFGAGRTRAVMTVVGVSSDGTGTVLVWNQAPGALDLVIDVNGYFAP
jgi:hypothetical protein